MTWEIALGIFALISAFVSVMGIVIRVNSTLAKLEEAVKDLREFMEHQHEKNELFRGRIEDHETRISLLERRTGQ